jgi:hypothetical protein
MTADSKPLPSLRATVPANAGIPIPNPVPGVPDLPIPDIDPEVESGAGQEGERGTASVEAAPSPPGPPSQEEQIAAELAERERLVSLGPVPGTGPTLEQLQNNPSDFRPEDHPEVDEGAINLGAEQVAAQNLSVLPEAAKPAVATPAADTDKRQRWVCIEQNGIRTEHPVFHSDVHLLENLVRCPVCDSTSVRMADPAER